MRRVREGGAAGDFAMATAFLPSLLLSCSLVYVGSYRNKKIHVFFLFLHPKAKIENRPRLGSSRSNVDYAEVFFCLLVERKEIHF